MARCPAHKGCQPSLSVQETNDGKVLVDCHAGCDQAQVIAALPTSGLHSLDLADGVRDCAWRWKWKGRRVRIARPPHGMDFNDLLTGRATRIGEGAL
jgi:hypothetical protein